MARRRDCTPLFRSPDSKRVMWVVRHGQGQNIGGMGDCHTLPCAIPAMRGTIRPVDRRRHEGDLLNSGPPVSPLIANPVLSTAIATKPLIRSAAFRADTAISLIRNVWNCPARQTANRYLMLEAVRDPAVSRLVTTITVTLGIDGPMTRAWFEAWVARAGALTLEPDDVVILGVSVEARAGRLLFLPLRQTSIRSRMPSPS